MNATQLLLFIIIIIIIIAAVLWVQNKKSKRHRKPQRGGLGEKCKAHESCAKGLTCSSNDTCICPKPQSPTVFVTTGPFSIDATWSAVEYADYYSVVLEGPQNETFMFHTSTSITIGDLEIGTYTLNVYAGSNECGVNETAGTVSNIVLAGCTSNSDCTLSYCNNGNCVACLSQTDCAAGQICNDNNACTGCTQDCECPNGQACVSGLCGTCTTNSECPTGQVCDGGHCISCTSNTQCLDGEVCSDGTCQPCTSDNQCDSGEFCSSGACVQCVLNTDCTGGEVCSAGQCVCDVPVVNSVTLSNGSWPNQITVQFNVSNADPNSLFTFGWQLYGDDNPAYVPVSAYAPNVLLSNVGDVFTFAISTSIPAAYTCFPPFSFGCPGTCGYGDVSLSFDHIVVTNSCGQSSSYQCFNLSSLCPGGPTVFTQTTC